LVRDDLVPQIKAHDAQLVAVQSVDVENPRLGKLRIPDLVVVPIAAMDAEAVDPRDIVLAVEIVSPSDVSNDLVETAATSSPSTTPSARTSPSGPWVVHTGSLKRYPERQPK
jgi:hypothetical protein